MRAIRQTKGLSLVELVVAIIVIGLAIPALTRNWFDITKRSIQSEELFDSTSYGEQLMEEIKSKRFDERTEPPWTPENFFASQRADETYEINNRTRFDDVDDYDEFGEALPESFRSSVQVSYVNLTGTAWQQIAGDETDFKRVIVSISRADGRANTTMNAVIGRY